MPSGVARPLLRKTGLDRVYAPLKRQRVLQRMRAKGHAGLFVDTGQQVLDSFLSSRAGKWPSSHMGQHLCAAIVVRDRYRTVVVGSARCHTDRF